MDLRPKAEFSLVASRAAQAAVLKAEKANEKTVDLEAAKKKPTSSGNGGNKPSGDGGDTPGGSTPSGGTPSEGNTPSGSEGSENSGNTDNGAGEDNEL